MSRTRLPSVFEYAGHIIDAIRDLSPATANSNYKFQFERFGYFVVDWGDKAVGKLVFDLSVGLTDI